MASISSKCENGGGETEAKSEIMAAYRSIESGISAWRKAM
jgi:hypothetical protein